MKNQVLYILISLSICIVTHNSQAISTENKAPDFTNVIQSLTVQLKNLQKEINKENAVVRLKECEVEIKWVWKKEGGGQ